MTLKDVPDYLKDAKTIVDQVAIEPTEAEHARTTSAISQQREDILSACSDTEREIATLSRMLKKRELHLAAFYSRQPSTNAALSSVTAQHQTILKSSKIHCHAAFGPGPTRGQSRFQTCFHLACGPGHTRGQSRFQTRFHSTCGPGPASG